MHIRRTWLATSQSFFATFVSAFFFFSCLDLWLRRSAHDPEDTNILELRWTTRTKQQTEPRTTNKLFVQTQIFAQPLVR